MKILLDTNILVDVLQKREPMFEYGEKIFLAIASKQIEGYITSKQVADIHFFSRKQFAGQENVDQKARSIIANLFLLFSVIDTLADDCKSAMNIHNNDYEDAIMIASAIRAGMDCIVTRDAKHFRNSPLQIYTSCEFVEQFLVG